jgi:3-oxoacyl-[acyl-carrier protein] reductase
MTHDAGEEQIRPLVVITGGRGGLGRALAVEFAARGWQVAAPGRDRLDVTDPAAVAAFFAPLPRCDALVNNAGLTRDRLLARMSEADWDTVIETNLGGAARCIRAAQPLLAACGGSVINIGSFAARAGAAGQANYTAAKAALTGLGQALAAELGPAGVRVNTVLPGFLETRMTAALPAAVVEKARAAHVLGRFNTAAAAARFIASLPDYDAISGQVFQLDSRLARWT